MTSVTTSNDAYASNVPDRGTTGFTTNGLNELATIDGGAVSYDTNGNLTIDPWLNHSFSYNAEDQMTAASQLSATAGLAYDPLGRLDTYNPSSGAFRRFVYDGDEVSAELDSSGAIVNRYVRGDAPDEVLLHYSGSGSSSYRYYHLDERSSPIAWSDEAGAMAAISHYDEFGIPDPTNPGRFQYTGQMWLSEIGEYFYKTRGFSANMGRFLQTDPMGYSVGPNLYEYAGSDPVNFADPLGRCQYPGTGTVTETPFETIIACPPWDFGFGAGSLAGGVGIGASGGERDGSGGRARIDGNADKKQQCPPHPILDAVGKAYGAINTLIGGVAASGSALAGALKGYTPQVNFGNNSIQVTNALTFGGRAYTIGNVQVYSPGNGPSASGTSYTGAYVSNGMHEEGHSIQSQILGPAYLPTELLGSLLGNSNPLEVGADKYALGESCTGF